MLVTGVCGSAEKLSRNGCSSPFRVKLRIILSDGLEAIVGAVITTKFECCLGVNKLYSHSNTTAIKINQIFVLFIICSFPFYCP